MIRIALWLAGFQMPGVAQYWQSQIFRQSGALDGIDCLLKSVPRPSHRTLFSASLNAAITASYIYAGT